MNMAMILGLFPSFMSMIAVYFILKAVGLTEGSLIRLALILCYSGGAACPSRFPKDSLTRSRRRSMRRR